jgi:hypothetical protein
MPLVLIVAVANQFHAQRAQDFGINAALLTGNEAAAHGDTVT